ncbi:MAG: PorV/PorQ family protein [Bacteroidia bacterium]|nr:PorV/PorQ family protein [Bacteroidia bacterium]MDW8348202.1 PorV/PorQ family protein [Bacteroidia bacterium]
MKILVPFLLLILNFVLTVSAQILPPLGKQRAGTAGMQFLKIPVDPRGAAMGESFIAVANDASALYWNPAGMSISDSQKIHLQGAYTRYFADITMNYGAGFIKLKNEHCIGVSLTHLNSGEMDVTTEFQPFGTGQKFSATNTAIGISYAKKLTDNFAFGLTSKYANESIFGLRTNTLLFDLGFQYDIGYKNLRFAVTMTNFGFNVKPKGEIEVIRLSGTQNVNNFEQVTVPSMFKVGFAWDAVKNDHHLLTLVGQLNHPTDNKETFNLGAEYSWNRLLYFRTGYQIGADESNIPSFGFGLKFTQRFGALKIDYAFTNKQRLGFTHKFGLGISF